MCSICKQAFMVTQCSSYSTYKLVGNIIHDETNTCMLCFGIFSGEDYYRYIAIAGYSCPGRLHECAVSCLYWRYKYWRWHQKVGLWAACCFWNTWQSLWYWIETFFIVITWVFIFCLSYNVMILVMPYFRYDQKKESENKSHKDAGLGWSWWNVK